MFLGEYAHSVDAKGRIILPSKFRARLAEGCVITRGQEACLYGFTPETFKELADELSRSRQSVSARRGFRRMFFSGAIEEVPDSQGRVTLPEHLRTYANLSKDLTVIGAGPHFEIWDRESWLREQERLEADYRDLDIDDPDFGF